ncbi:substrate-binding domain-containing protein [Rhodobacteraceae bacterium 2CG4]|uniref:Substrate-binding domain-containing protein n=1 Tax=Halovulum marinum TaxID=2662447 RepID=A0A6L5Z0P5_9RHOB|nr:LacI family DNA-binding transcriptional regulator [Halovulum marinum]MSU90058.1 substrate-binding domain-containing protein [Halovulum marinum]
MSSIKSIARDLGVSTATVSNALSGKGRVSDELARRIREHAGKVGYHPSPAARALKTGRSGILGLVMPNLTNPLFPRLAHNIEAAADSRGFGVLIADSRSDAAGQAAAIERLVRRGVDGIVIVPHRGTRVTETDVPLAVINAASDPANTVSADHRQGGRLAAGLLMDMGHRRFLLAGEDPRSEVQQDRIAGAAECLARRGGTGHRVCWTSEAAPDLLAALAGGVTAIVTSTDLLALKLLSEAQTLDIAVPGRLSVIGFDNLPFGEHLRPSLSTIAPDVPEIAHRALSYLDARLSGAAEIPPPSVVPMIAIQRDSTGLPQERPVTDPARSVS